MVPRIEFKFTPKTNAFNHLFFHSSPSGPPHANWRAITRYKPVDDASASVDPTKVSHLLSAMLLYPAESFTTPLPSASTLEIGRTNNLVMPTDKCVSIIIIMTTFNAAITNPTKLKKMYVGAATAIMKK